MSHVRSAVEDDVPELVRLRALLFDTLGENWGPPPARGDWRAECAAALKRHILDETMRVLVVDGDDGLASCGAGVIDRRLPSPYNPNGVIGHVFGVVTDPGYREWGYARKIMEELLRWFGELNIVRVDLNASLGGQSLYRRLGFAEHPDPMLSWKR